jgi:hydroxymethylpyrimidine/phosphomethylpyrimidine kinase
VDLLISAAGVQRIRSKRLSGSSRGTGCALASAIAASLVKGRSLAAACEAGKTYVLGMLEPGQTPPVMFEVLKLPP